MKREIKFRAWDGKKMHHNAIVGNGQTLYIPDATGEYKWNSQAEVHPMQFTGRKDVNAVEIYEGDIIRHGESIRTIEYGSSNFHAIRTNRQESLLLSFSASPEVIGNIYETPELLNS